MWNISKDDWDDPLTSIDGLASNNVRTLDYDYSVDVAYIGTPVGIARWNFSSNTGLATINSVNGLVGDNTVATIGFFNSQGTFTLFASHNGAGKSRPGVSQFDLPYPSTIFTHRPDQLPHNTVTAVATDWWGVHIATVGEPITHWNASTGQFEDGAAIWQLPAWPSARRT